MVVLKEPFEIKCVSDQTPIWNFIFFDINNPRKSIKKVVKPALISTKGLITINVAKLKHQGTYKCTGTFANGTGFERVAQVFVGGKCEASKCAMCVFA